MSSNYHVTNGVVVSLAEPMAGLKLRYREYLPQNQQREFHHVPFLGLLLRELFDPTIQHTVGGLPPSTQVLMNLQIDKRYATMMRNEAFDHVVDAIAPYMPDARAGCRYQLINAYDLLISPP